MATLFESSLEIVIMQSVKSQLSIICTGSEWTQSRTTGKYSIAYWIVQVTAVSNRSFRKSTRWLLSTVVMSPLLSLPDKSNHRSAL